MTNTENAQDYIRITPEQQQEIQKNFGQWLKLLRLAGPERVTQQDIAKRAGVSRPHYSQIETGEHKTNIDTAIKLARAFGYGEGERLSEFLLRAGHPDISKIPNSIATIPWQGNGIGIDATGQPIEILPDYLNLILQQISSTFRVDGLHREIADLREIVVKADQRQSRIERSVDLLVEQIRPKGKQ